MKYSTVTANLFVKQEINPIYPLIIVKGKYNTVPRLPVGLEINSDGSITGKPQKVTHLTSYTITVETVEGEMYATTIQLESINNSYYF